MKNNGDIKNFIFDLDETLYSPNIPIMKIIGENINTFMQDYLGLPSNEIIKKRSYYKNHYGTTLYGLINEYNINPYQFLSYVHNIDYKKLLKKDAKLYNVLKGLKGSFFIYTNASKAHAINVLEELGVTEFFNKIISIEDTEFLPKPHILGFHKFFEQTQVNCSESIFIEDNPKNLATAIQMNMKTAIVWNHDKDYSEFDYNLETIYNIDILTQ
jgi:putative hydrolase of the HAD superfamily